MLKLIPNLLSILDFFEINGSIIIVFANKRRTIAAKLDCITAILITTNIIFIKKQTKRTYNFE
jgi:hypothetical protein